MDWKVVTQIAYVASMITVNKIARSIPLEFDAWFQAAVRNVPGFTGICLRRLIFRLALGRMGDRNVMREGCRLHGARNIRLGHRVTLVGGVILTATEESSIEIGDDVAINRNVHIDAAPCGTISIGDDCLVGPNVVMRACNHNFSQVAQPIRLQGHQSGGIVVGRNVWIGANVIILPNVTVGENSIVGAGAVVTRNFPAGSIIGGVPARVLRSRTEARSATQ